MRAALSVTAAIGVAAGGLAVWRSGGLAGANVAVSAPAAPQSAVTSRADAPRAVNNLGLSNSEAKDVQCFPTDYWGYHGSFYGRWGTESWQAMQRNLQANWGSSTVAASTMTRGTGRPVRANLPRTRCS